MKPVLEIVISNDTATLGPDATRADLEAFGDALAERVAEEFGCDVQFRLDSVSRSRVGSSTGHYEFAEEIELWLHAFERSDECTALLSGG
jgi:hypothetical protein